MMLPLPVAMMLDGHGKVVSPDNVELQVKVTGIKKKAMKGNLSSFCHLVHGLCGLCSVL